MTTLNELTTQKIFNFLSQLDTEISINDYVNIEDIDFDNAFDYIYESIQDNSGFDIEIIYYSNAIEYLQKNDPSLKESLEIAIDFGYSLEKISSEVLASLLASKNAVENFYNLESEINTFFLELSEELTTLEN
jgi:hypothetical protein